VGFGRLSARRALVGCLGDCPRRPPHSQELKKLVEVKRVEYALKSPRGGLARS